MSARSWLRAAVPAVLVVLFAAAACAGSSSDPNPVVDVPATTVTLTATPAATPTPLATEPVATPTVTSTQVPTAQPTAEPTAAATGVPTIAPAAAAAFYKPAGWDGVSDVNCPDFDTHAHALSFFIGTGGTTSNDPHRLDANHDGNPCESLP